MNCAILLAIRYEIIVHVFYNIKIVTLTREAMSFWKTPNNAPAVAGLSHTAPLLHLRYAMINRTRGDALTPDSQRAGLVRCG